MLSCLALFCYLLGPLHALAMSGAKADTAAETLVICTGHGLQTIAVPGAPDSGGQTGNQACPSCLSCPMPCCAGAAPSLLTTTAPAPVGSGPLQPGTHIAGSIPHSPQSDPASPRGPPFLG